MADAFGFGGSSGGTAMVRMVLDTGGYQSKLNAVHSQTVAKTSSMGQGFSKLGALAKQALGALGAVELIRRSVAAYDEQTKAVARLNVAFGNSPALAGASTQAFIAQASALSKLTGVQDEEIISAQAALAVFDLTADQLARLTPLVVDYARFTGTDVVSAAASVGRAVLGNARALKTIGIDFKRTGDSAKDFEGVISAIGNKVGGAAAKMATPLDHMRVTVDEAFESIGKELAPAVEALSAIMTDTPAPVLAAAAALVTFKLAAGGSTLGVIGLGVAVGELVKMIPGVEDLNTALAEWLVPGTPTEPAWLDPMIEGIGEARDAVRDGTMSVEEFGKVVEEFNDRYDIELDPEGILKTDSALSALAARTKETQFAIEHFAGMTDEEFDTWSTSVAESLNFVEGALSRMAGKTDITAAGVIKSVREAMRSQLDYARNSNTAFTAVREDFGVSGDAFVEYVAGLGQGGAELVGILSRLAGANRAKFREIVGDFITAANQADNTAGRIGNIGDAVNRLPSGKRIVITADTANAYSAVIALVNAVSAIPAYKTVHIYADLPGGVALADGGIYRGAAGLITRGPVMRRSNVMLGEGSSSTPWGPGAEAAIPLNAQGRKIIAEAFGMALRENRTAMAGGVLKVYGPGDPDLIADAVIRKMARM
jgi:hypothetical protein